ncbi:hypothetical protein LXA43DRAFT_716656 [Ganoderma leucocontextum]|nr:hypothetical protein LXA43DRAFT_716656 [Ganoderma leucocontextum]
MSYGLFVSGASLFLQRTSWQLVCLNSLAMRCIVATRFMDLCAMTSIRRSSSRIPNTFIAPNTTSAFATYLQLCALLMNALPTHALEPPQAKTDAVRNWADYDSDSEEETRVEVVDSFQPKIQLPPLDDRTRKRLLAIPAADHITSLLRASQNPALLDT